jgi:ABC-2 type transport system ATP-binding protein
VLTTQYLDEADQLAAQMVIIDGGRVIAEGTSGELKSMAGTDRIELHTGDTASLTLAASALSRAGIGEPSVDPAILRCSIAAVGGPDLLTVVARALDDAGVTVEDITMRRPTLDEVFLALTGQPSAASGVEDADTMSRPAFRPPVPTDTDTDNHQTQMVATVKEER